MIIVKLSGGLGNQMFQYAIGRNLSINNDDELYLDDLIYSQKNVEMTQRCLAINNFNINYKTLSYYSLKKYNFFNKLILKLHLESKFENFLKMKYFNEKQFHYDSEILKLKKSAYLDGYWQSEKYFVNIRNILLKEFVPKTKIDAKYINLLDIIKSSNSISIHFRLGDYLNNPKINNVHGVCSLEYYYNAIKLICDKISNPLFFIFSDDVNYVKNNLKINFPVYYVNSQDDCWDLHIMSNCKHNIIANSSYSWWGAWLNVNYDKIVIAPEKWFNNFPCITDDLYLNNWIKIKN